LKRTLEPVTRRISETEHRIELITGGVNGTRPGDYWRLTNRDGTQYYFGLNHLGWMRRVMYNGTDVLPQLLADTRALLAEAWDLVVFGTELATGYSELVDPVFQRERPTEQSLRAAAGDPEAMQLDEDFIRAMEYGMPPSGGIGMGVDRLLMTLTGLGIRDTILYPLVRSE